MKAIQSAIQSLVVLSLLILSISCKQTKDKTEQNHELSKMEQVMAIHDEVMPKMGSIGKLVSELEEKADTTALGKPYLTAKHDLQASHKAMMDWMRGFGDRFDAEEILEGKKLTDQKTVWLDEEEQKVIALKQQINSSIEKASILLKE